MADIKKASVTTLYLPSTEHEVDEDARLWVKMRDRLTFRDLLLLNELSSDTDKAFMMLRSLVVEWNCAVNGVVMDVTDDNINELDPVDLLFLTQWAGKKIEASTAGLATDEKKTSSATLIPVVDTPAPTI